MFIARIIVLSIFRILCTCVLGCNAIDFESETSYNLTLRLESILPMLIDFNRGSIVSLCLETKFRRQKNDWTM